MTLCGCAGVCGGVCVCSLQYCRRDGVIHIYRIMVCVSLKRRIGRRVWGGEGGGVANTTEVRWRRCAAAVQQKADETLWRAQLDV